MNLSFWEKETFFKSIDIAIIGSGIVGLCAAIELKIKYPNKKVVIFERSFLPSGASTKNAGFACFGSISEISKDLTQFTENEVYSLIEQRWKGLIKLKSLLGEANIGYQNIGGFELFDNDQDFEKYSDQIAYFNKNLDNIIGKKVYQIQKSKIQNFGFKNVSNLVFNQYEGLVHTGKMMKSLLEKAKNLDVEILNGIDIKAITETRNGVDLKLSETDHVAVSQVLIATNAFVKDLLPALDLLPGRGQVIITKPIYNLKVEGAFHLEQGYYYFRNIGNRLLFGGGRNLDFKAEETDQFGTTELVQNKLKELLKNVILPDTNFEIDYTWSGIMAFGNTQAPIVEALSDKVFCAVKCQGMGVALGALIGEKASNLM
jgi:gamma-glutamylputrescine oxidase